MVLNVLIMFQVHVCFGVTRFLHAGRLSSQFLFCMEKGSTRSGVVISYTEVHLSFFHRTVHRVHKSELFFELQGVKQCL